MRAFLIVAAALIVGCHNSRPMICQACQKQEAIVDWHMSNLDTGRDEHLQLCQACADARTDPRLLEQFRAARARGETGAISGWSSYAPLTNP